MSSLNLFHFHETNLELTYYANFFIYDRQKAAGDEYYRCPFGGEDWRNFLYRPSTQEIFDMSVRDQKETDHEIADGWAWSLDETSGK